MYMMFPSVNLKQLGIIILAIRDNHTNKIENVLTKGTKGKCKAAVFV